MFIVEVNESETRLPDSRSVCGLLCQIATAVEVSLWVKIDHGPRRRNLLQRLFGASARDIEQCFWLAKAGDVAVLTFLDRAWSEYRSTDPAYPVQATAEQRIALSAGEPTPAPPEVCLQVDRALQAAIEYLQSGERPSWLTYRYLR
jgi:hypothetical protein